VTPDGRLADPVRAPERTLTVGFTHGIAVSELWSLNSTLSAQYTSDFIADTTEQSVGEAHTTLNASIALDNGDWRVALDCENCTDREYFVSRIPPVSPYLNRPGSWSLRVMRRF
jgi:hypothetical protein